MPRSPTTRTRSVVVDVVPDLDLSQENRKRSSRACDQCRKTKSKCDPSDIDGMPCRSCATTGVECLYLGPSFKRGPPKGYIHALERRLHEVEAVLGTLIGSSDPRARSLIADLSKDPLAKNIVQRVVVGPFGPSGRSNELSHSGIDESHCASLLGDDMTESSRLAFQSRQLREQLSLDDGNFALPRPTRQWQNSLLRRLSMSPDSPKTDTERSSLSPNSAYTENSMPFYPKTPEHWTGLYTFDDGEEAPQAVIEDERKVDMRRSTNGFATRPVEEDEALSSRMIASMLGIDIHPQHQQALQNISNGDHHGGGGGTGGGTGGGGGSVGHHYPQYKFAVQHQQQNQQQQHQHHAASNGSPSPSNSPPSTSYTWPMAWTPPKVQQR
ncbi:hypothetical protein BD410DRAFT_393356 [Rickenella mellea]|uniref:Zn(2)-C6 fungal-type domain-containing protein n=1 Tax=Rickenella mellea TaxID=50990 RepID=A0A4Y7PYE3_9AGAM|nr:hypothetical protein BD410DRAFT_393356 [Rickenella mellea]